MYELCLRQLPSGLQVGANGLVIFRVVAWCSERDSGDEATADCLVQRGP